MNTKTINVFKMLQGKWKLQRSILSSATHYEISGVAEFKETSPDILHYKETGIFEINNTRQNFSREYEYSYQPDENIIQVYFIENSKRAGIFHAIKLDGLIATAQHFCVNDNYNVRYTFFKNNNNKFEISYDVSGPAKNYVSINRFNRSK